MSYYISIEQGRLTGFFAGVCAGVFGCGQDVKRTEGQIENEDCKREYRKHQKEKEVIPASRTGDQTYSAGSASHLTTNIFVV